jgi:hypothetical protein
MNPERWKQISQRYGAVLAPLAMIGWLVLSSESRLNRS